LRKGSDFFKSKRLIFGLSSGPAILESSVELFYQICCEIYDAQPSLFEPFFDDLLLGNSDEIFYQLLIDVGHLCGLTFKSARLEKFDENLLGCKIAITEENSISKLKITCPSKILPEFNMNKFTKRDYFKLCGILSAYNRASIHPELTLISDVLKSMLGNYDWNTPLKFTNPDEIELITELITTANTLLNSKPECHHYYFTDSPSPVNLILRTDASKTAHGFQLLATNRGNSFEIISSISIFKTNSDNWHSNRKELYAVLTGLKQTYNLIMNSRIQFESLKIETDNKATASWSDLNKKFPSSKAIEEIALKRLAATIRELLSELIHSKNLKISIDHIPGKENLQADFLSRFGSTFLDKYAKIRLKDPKYVLEDIMDTDITLSIDSIDSTQSDKSEELQDVCDIFMATRTFEQLKKRMKGLIQIQRKVKKSNSPPNIQDNTNLCIYEYAQLELNQLKELATRKLLKLNLKEFDTKLIKEYNSYNCFLHDGILCSLVNPTPVPILPPQSPISYLITKSIHYKFAHMKGINLLSKIKNLIFCKDIRTIGNKIEKNCVYCHVRSIKKIDDWNFISHPRSPLKDVWKTIGIDHFSMTRCRFGPENIVINLNCLIIVDKLSRFISLEPVLDRTMDNAVIALAGCFSKLGYPRSIRCDKAFISNAMQEYCDGREIVLKTAQASYAPSYGGFYERQIDLCRKMFHSRINSQLPSLNESIIVIRDICTIINDRPICPRGIELNYLTPNDIIFGCQKTNIYDNVINPDPPDPTPENLTEIYYIRKLNLKNNSQLMKILDDYMIGLTQMSLSYNMKSRTVGEPFRTGETVLVKQGSKFFVAKIINDGKKHSYSLRHQSRGLITVELFPGGRQVLTDSDSIRRFEIDI
jgi:hypothetical protein